MEETLAVVRRLTTQAQALAALAARLRLDELGLEGEPAVRRRIDDVVKCLELSDLDELTPAMRGNLLAGVRTNLRQALELLEQPERPAAWTHADPVLLQAQGKASSAIAGRFVGSGLGRPGVRILDIGTGVGMLAIAFCAAYENATVVGVDPWAPALELARRNIAEAGLEARISLVQAVVEDLEDADGFDLVWLPSSFIPDAAIDASLRRVHDIMRQGAEVVMAVFEHEDPLAGAVEDLKTARAGGSVLTVDAAIVRMERAGFSDVALASGTWKGPMRLVVGHRALV